MRLLHIAHQYYPDHVGGVEYHTRLVTQSLVQRGHQVDLFYRRFADSTALDQKTDSAGVRLWAAQAGPFSATNRFRSTFSNNRLQRHFETALADSAPDLVHIQHLLGLPLSMMAAIARHKLRYVVTLHDYWWICANAQLVTNDTAEICDGPDLYLNCARCMLARANRTGLWPLLPPLAGIAGWRNHRLHQVLTNAAALIAPTPFVRAWYADQGLPADKIHLLPHGLPTPPSEAMLTRTETAAADRPLQLAYIGGLSSQKGVHILLEAFAQLEGRAELWLAGCVTTDPEYVTRLQELATPDVHFLGTLSRDAVWQQLAQVDAVVVPSLWYEAFSYLVSEAFVMGVPVIASNLGALADRIRDGEDGLLFPAGDVAALQQSLQRLISEPALLPRLRAGIRPVHTLPQQIDALESLYQRVLATELQE